MRLKLLILLLVANATAGYIYAATINDNDNILIKSTISNQHINAFVEDDLGYMWIGTAKGLCRYNGYEYQYYYHDPQGRNSMPSDFITALYLDSHKQLWVATDNGACRYNYKTDDFSNLRYSDVTRTVSLEYGFTEAGGTLYVYGGYGVKSIDRDKLIMFTNAMTEPSLVRTMIEDGNSRLWIWENKEHLANGLVCTDKNFKTANRINFDPSVNASCSYLTKCGELWFGTNKGIIAVDPQSKAIIEPIISKTHKARISQLQITFFRDIDEQNVFIGTENKGLFRYNFHTDEFTSISQHDYFAGNTSTHVTCCYSDRDRNLWLGTFDKGYYYDSNTPRKFNNDPSLNSNFDGKFVTRIVEDGSGNLWVGTRYDGIIHYDRKNKKTTTYNQQNFKPLTLSNTNLVESLYIDSNGNLWIGCGNYLSSCRINAEKIIDYKIYKTEFGTSSIMEDNYKRIWVGASSGSITIYDVNHKSPPLTVPLRDKTNNVTKIIKLNSGEMLFSNYGKGIFTANPTTLAVRALAIPDRLRQPVSRAIFIYEDVNSKIWIGTYGQGLVEFNRSSDSSSVYLPKNGLPSNDVLAIAEDENRNIWVSTSYGISKLNSEDRTFSNYYDYDGTGGNQFHEKSVLKSNDGTIYFGGNHGITYFNSNNTAVSMKDIHVLLEDLKILNISESIKQNGVLSKHISQTESITLDHKQNIFSIDYSGIDLAAPRKIKYAYMLTNLDKDWNYVDGFRRATYSNLYPGTYTFYVKARNSDGTWTQEPTALTIHIKAAPWLSATAIICYFIIIVILILACIRIYLRFKLDKDRIDLMERKRSYENKMTDLKINFFTNISHELRTPLSMIYAPVKKLMDKNIDTDTREYLTQLIDYNVNNLLKLIDQTMDFVKLESDTSSLMISQSDVRTIVTDLINNYAYFAERKGIRVELRVMCESTVMPIDKDKVGKIVSNLLSNALKYTPDSGHVIIEIDITEKPDNAFDLSVSSDKFLSVKVIDNGVGMSSADLEQLFKRYKRFDSSKEIAGNGIGLNYVKQLIEQHKGAIIAELREPKGMIFSFVVPIDSRIYQPYEIAESSPAVREVVDTTATDSTLPDSQEDRDNRDTILIVEDDTELLSFLSYLFRDKYNVVMASDGLEGYNKCGETDIDLIISDVLMPQMDGYELCSTIKNDPMLCHIPIILLTAKTMEANQIEGYSLGADAYINKPFNPTLLETIVRNTFTNINRRQSMILQKTPEESNPEDKDIEKMNPLDQKFLERMYLYIDRELSNCDLNVNTLGKELAFSRTSFYRKIKGLTGQSPNDFLRMYRLNKAADLLRRNEYSINEIVDLTGFGTHSYFSACFKRQFGVTPKEFCDR